MAGLVDIIRLEGPEDTHLRNSRFGGHPLGFDWEGLAASRSTADGHSGRPLIKQPWDWFP